MVKANLGSGKELIAEAKRLQTMYNEFGTYWSLESCLQSIIESETIETNQKAIDSAMIVAKGIDQEK